MVKLRILSAGLLVSLTLTACQEAPNRPTYKNRGEGPATGTPSPGTPMGGGPVGGEVGPGKTPSSYALTCEKAETRRGIRAWRRLSNQEITNTVKAVFMVKDDFDYSSLVNDIPKHGLFDTVQADETFMDANRLKGYESLAKEVVASSNLGMLFPCILQGEQCVAQRLPEIGSLAWRRPFLAEDARPFIEMFRELTKEGATPSQILPFIIQALVMSPNFLYRTELGVMNANNEFELTSWEIASAISYLITRHPPDQALRELAQKDMLKDTATITAQIKRLFADAKAKTAMGDFGDMWFDGSSIVGVLKNEPKFNSQAKQDLQNDLRGFFSNLMLDQQNGTFNELLTASAIPAKASSSFIYGAMPGADGKMSYAQPERRGLLGHAAFLASFAFTDTPNPITRGVFVTKRLLCNEFGMVKMMEVPEQKKGLTNKERFRKHSEVTVCANCHKGIDPFGFAMEKFDALGIYRTMDEGQPIVIDSKFELDGKEVTISEAQQLGKVIADSKQGQECFVRQAFRYTFGRYENVPRPVLGGDPMVDDSNQRKLDQCEIDSAVADMKAAGGKLQQALISMITSPAFRVRLKGELPAIKNELHLTGGSH